MIFGLFLFISRVMLNGVKHLMNVSRKVPARDPSDTTFCQDDKTLVLFLKLWTLVH